MRPLGRLGVATAMIVATSAVVASNAFALPEVGRCVAQPETGKYKNAVCTEKAGTRTSEKQFEFLKGAKAEQEGVNFTAAGGEATIETESATKLTCKTENARGKYDEDLGVIKEVESVVLVFKECEIPTLGGKCTTAGAVEGEIVSFALKGPLGYISGEKTKVPVVGLELTPEKAKGLFEEFECLGGAVKWRVKGKEGKFISEGTEVTGGNCIIAPLTEVNVMTTTFDQTYSGSGGKQSPQKFQPTTSDFCGLESNTNGGPFESMTWAMTTETTNEEALEVKA